MAGGKLECVAQPRLDANIHLVLAASSLGAGQCIHCQKRPISNTRFAEITAEGSTKRQNGTPRFPAPWNVVFITEVRTLERSEAHVRPGFGIYP